MGDRLAAALEYVRLGWQLIPVRPGEKVPEEHEWTSHGYRDADQVRRWWGSGDRNIGLLTGRPSGLWVLDIDQGGEDSLDALLRRHGPLPDTVEAQTPNGGRHVFFRLPADGGSVPNRVKLDVGIDTRGDGGQVLLAPSQITTRRGGLGTYCWEESSRPEDVPLAEAPGWLVAWVRNGRSQNGHQSAETPETIKAGARNTTLHRLGSALRGQGLPGETIHHALLVVNEFQCQPPLDAAEVERIAGSVAQYQQGQVLAVPDFSKRKTVAVLHQQATPRPDFIVDPILYAGTEGDGGNQALLVGKGGVGKTWAAFDLARCVSQGVDWYGLPTKRVPVGLVELELPDWEVRERFTAFDAATDTRWCHDVVVWTRSDLGSQVDLRDDATRTALARYVRDDGIQLLVLDPFSHFHASDENSAADATTVMAAHEDLSRQTGAAIFMVHHPRKGLAGAKDQDGDSVRGSGVFVNRVGSVLGLVESRSLVKLAFYKVRSGRSPEPVYLLRTATGPLVVTDEPPDRSEAKQQRLEKTKQLFGDGQQFTVADLQQALDDAGIPRVSDRTLKSDLAALGAKRRSGTGPVATRYHFNTKKTNEV